MERAIILEAESVAAQSDQTALEQRFSLFVGSHRERARRLAWRLVGGDEGAADDVTQEAFIKAYQGLGKFRQEASLDTWFYRILVRQAHNYRRWRSVRDTWGSLWSQEEADKSVPVESQYGDPSLRRRINQALENLTRSQREAFILVHMEGFTVRECAELLGKPTGTVKSHIHRALTGLRTELVDLQELSDASPVVEERRI